MQASFNLRNTSMKTNFTDTFNAEMEDIKSRAAAVGLSVNELCKRAGLARATPDRWSKKEPNTVALVAKMQAVVLAEEQKVQAAKVAAQSTDNAA